MKKAWKRSALDRAIEQVENRGHVKVEWGVTGLVFIGDILQINLRDRSVLELKRGGIFSIPPYTTHAKFYAFINRYIQEEISMRKQTKKWNHAWEAEEKQGKLL